MATASVHRQSVPFLPKADAAVLSAKFTSSLPSDRPQTIDPIFDPENFDNPVEPWTVEAEKSRYPPQTTPYAPAAIPEPPTCVSERYLRGCLASNERLRLSMLWYYTADIFAQTEFLSGLQEKVHLARESTEWEYAVIGILDVNVYIRLATVGLSLGILPRGETICAHTINQPPGDVFLLPNMLEDWRFRNSPYVESGGLRAYAGAPLRLKTEAGDTVCLGSFCVASSTIQEPLTKSQQHTIAHLADWVVSDLVQCTRVRRQRERRRMSDLLSAVHGEFKDVFAEEPILSILKATYPDTVITIKSSSATSINVEGRAPILLSELEDGVWEDSQYLDDFIANSNCKELPRDRVVRALAAKFEGMSGPSLLLVASKDFRLVFDDIDLWFVQTCASMLSQMWQKCLLAEAMVAKEKFLRGFSHQLRTPIHGILGSVELLAEELMSRSNLVEAQVTSTTEFGGHSVYLDTIKTSGRDLISTVNSMITLNRWADIAIKERCYATHTIGELETELANETIKAITGDSRYRASIFFNQGSSSTCAGFRTDLNLLRDSLFPLIMNAIQNTQSGIVNVTISMHMDTKELTIDVEDSGSGIHADHHKRIFEPYEKVGEHSTGAGLGLTLSSKFSTLLNGSIVLVSSSPDRGSHFRATFGEVEYASVSTSPEPPAGIYKNIPSRFHRLPVSSDCTLECDGFTKLLIQHGFEQSDNIQDSIVVIPHTPDTEEFHKHVTSIPPGQVGICPVPGPVGDGTPKQSCDKVVHLHGPFSRSTLASALLEADKLLSKLKDSESQHGSVTPALAHPTVDADLGQQPTTQEITLPIRLHAESALGSQPDIATQPGPEPSLPLIQEPTDSVFKTVPSKPTALLVDDNVINLRIMQMYCSKRGLPYFSATNGQEAVEMFLKHQSLASAGEAAPIQLILMDLQMPVCDGLDATRQIRALEKEKDWGHGALFIVTGQDNPSDRTASDDAGADEFFVKPLSLKVLDRHMKQYFPAFSESKI